MWFFFLFRLFCMAISDRQTISDVFLQRVDHFNSSRPDLFTQSFFVNSNYGVSPYHLMILYLGGWEALDPAILEYPIFCDLARRSGSPVVGLEHRYFGNSYPRNDSAYDFLTVRQAMSDIAYFIDAFNETFTDHHCRATLIG
jgi:hypothetical protein